MQFKLELHLNILNFLLLYIVPLVKIFCQNFNWCLLSQRVKIIWVSFMSVDTHGFQWQKSLLHKNGKPDLSPKSQMAHTFLAVNALLGKETFHHFKSQSLCFIKGVQSGMPEVISMHIIKKNEMLVVLRELSSSFPLFCWTMN